MQTSAPDLTQLKSRMKATWMAGDLGRIAHFTAFARLDQAGQDALAAQLESLWAEHNTAEDGTTAVKGEYLDVRAVRA